MKTLAMLLVTATAFAGCAAPGRAGSMPAAQADGLVRARLGQSVTVGGPRITPLQVLEDSRCPAKVACVWAGRVRVSVRIDLGSGSQVREIQQGQPIGVADGTLELVEVQPARAAPTRPRPQPAKPAYQSFAFRFTGGL